MKTRPFQRHLLFCALLLGCLGHVNAQHPTSSVDSLMAVTTSGHDTLKVQAYTELCRLLRTTSTEQAIEFGVKARNLAATISDRNGEAMGRQTLANAYIIAGNYGKALRELHLANDLNNLGVLYTELGKHKEALDHLRPALR